MVSAIENVRVPNPVRILNKDDLSRIRSIIKGHIELALNREVDSIQNYHMLGNNAHALMRPKSSRILSADATAEVMSMESFETLKSTLPGYVVGPVVDERGVTARPEVYFRLVRPDSPNDTGLPHLDHWFHRKAGLPYAIGTTYKVWISIVSEPGLNGLCFFPQASTQRLYEIFRNESEDCTDFSQVSGNPIMPYVAPGEGFFFRDDVIHGGIPNRGTHTRCSVEITFIRS
jgi:hypothetical protein